jgi:hypothetical protein
MADQVLARINAHLGWRCVGKLAFKQGPIERDAKQKRHGASPSPQALAAAAHHVGAIEADGLRAALARLGAHVIQEGAPQEPLAKT